MGLIDDIKNMQPFNNIITNKDLTEYIKSCFKSKHNKIIKKHKSNICNKPVRK